MRILYKYLTTSLFPRHIEPEVWPGTVLPPSLLPPLSLSMRMYVVCIHAHAHPGWGAGGRAGGWSNSVVGGELRSVQHITVFYIVLFYVDIYVVVYPLAQKIVYVSPSLFCYVQIQ